MLKKLALACALLLPSVSRAQTILQDESTTLYSLRTYLTKQSDTQYLYEVQFRNEQAYSPTIVYGIANIYVYGNFGYGSEQLRGPTTKLIGVLGTNLTVPTAQVNAMYPNDPLVSRTDYFLQGGGSYPGSTVAGPDPDGLRSNMQYGVLGCAAPINFATAFNYYVASTCAAAGFTGWVALDYLVTFAVANATYDAADLRSTVGVGSATQAAFNVVPEPATYAMLGLGLLVVGVVRKRTRVL